MITEKVPVTDKVCSLDTWGGDSVGSHSGFGPCLGQLSQYLLALLPVLDQGPEQTNRFVTLHTEGTAPFCRSHALRLS